MNDLPKVATWQRNGRLSNPRPFESQPNALTITTHYYPSMDPNLSMAIRTDSLTMASTVTSVSDLWCCPCNAHTLGNCRACPVNGLIDLFVLPRAEHKDSFTSWRRPTACSRIISTLFAMNIHTPLCKIVVKFHNLRQLKIFLRLSTYHKLIFKVYLDTS